MRQNTELFIEHYNKTKETIAYRNENDISISDQESESFVAKMDLFFKTKDDAEDIFKFMSERTIHLHNVSIDDGIPTEDYDSNAECALFLMWIMGTDLDFDDEIMSGIHDTVIINGVS